ncbi:MAG: hypothetical protein L0215_27020 [Gemmataceae bacterium]|nr:hypothetical protein [Gemmataceae bacterium]
MFSRMRTLAVVLFIALFFASSSVAQQATLRIMGWNLQGNGDDIDPKLLVEQLGIKQGVDIWGLSEVRPELFDDFLEGAKIGEAAEFEVIRGESGKNIRLAIIYNKSKLDLVASEELFKVFGLKKNSGLRAPLTAHFRGKKTKQEFIFMVNHLASGNAKDNEKQAIALREWVKTQSLPIIATGDYNSFDNRPVVKIMKETWFELEPIHNVPSFAKPLSGRIDHVFIGNRDKAVGWTGTAAIFLRESDELAVGPFTDTKKTTDHQPIGATFTINAVKEPPVEDDDDEPLLRQLLRRIDRLEERIRKLENK